MLLGHAAPADGGEGEGRGAEGAEARQAGAVRHPHPLEAPRHGGREANRAKRNVRIWRATLAQKPTKEKKKNTFGYVSLMDPKCVGPLAAVRCLLLLLFQRKVWGRATGPLSSTKRACL